MPNENLEKLQNEQVIDLPDPTEITGDVRDEPRRKGKAVDINMGKSEDIAPSIAPVAEEVVGENEMLPQEGMAPVVQAAPVLAAPAAQPLGLTEAPMAMPAAAPVENPSPFMPTPNPQDLDMEAAKFASDLFGGKIQPKNMVDLNSERNSNGRMGTFLALLMGGMGSGLSKQPNAVLEMMKKDMDNDFEAQKTNQTNAQNWYKLATENERNKALNFLTTAQALHQPAMTQESFANAAKIYGDTIGAAQAYAYKGISDLYGMQQLVDGMPLGSPQREKAQYAIDNYFKPFIFSVVSQKSQTGVQQYDLVKNLSMSSPPYVPQNPMRESTAVDQKRIEEIKKMAQRAKELGVPSPVSFTSDQSRQLDTEVGEAEKIHSVYSDYLNAYDELAKGFLAKKPFPELRDSYIDPILPMMNSLAEQMGHTPGIDFRNSIFPNPGDAAETVAKKRENGIKLFKTALKKATPLSSGLKVVKELPNKSKPKEGAKGIHKPTGKPAVYRNGKWGPE